MFNQFRNAAVIAVGFGIAVIMLSIAAFIAIPVLLGLAALGFAARGILNARLDQALRERQASTREEMVAGDVIEGEWTVLDQRTGETGRSW